MNPSPQPPDPPRDADSGDPRETVVELSGIAKSFGGRAVLSALDLRVGRGEKLVLIGPSGSGKSTILRIVMTLETPDAGLLAVGGDTATWGPGQVPPDRARLEAIRRHSGMVFQQFHLFPHLTAWENIALAPVVVGGEAREAARARAREWLERVGLAHRVDAHPAQLSGGEKQRVAIARALAPDPDVLLLDEITSALDPERVGEVVEVITDLAADASRSFLLVTHQLRFARRIADRIVYLEDGGIVEEGPPDALLDDPQDPRTRRFLAALDL